MKVDSFKDFEKFPFLILTQEKYKIKYSPTMTRTHFGSFRFHP